ncbi:DUF4179 domain-containing protein [Sporosarcina sp. ANT_H38]|uniref:DUF4179 domain-containing protein n=1 Tax=Sporosarcina sp. ANT_H38 TaxID=2597358 RepID=UPI0011F21310|nr:DUF4179 domain-containing protein [Sporosarcina sp. ANT_H38]KAA0966923.1 DUF4179 domain-containing protein [Sporosarcina sp. ANT_H38]
MDCNDIQEHFIDYLEGKLGEMTRKEIEQHLTECESCNEEVKKLRQIVAALDSENDSIQVPDDFMSNVRHAVFNNRENRRKKYKHRTTVGIVAMLFFTLFVGTAVATNNFTSVMNWWKDLSNKQDEQMQGYVQQGLGEYMNFEAESNGVKVTITSVVADDIQTLVYYEIEDQQKDNNYMINYNEGLQIENLHHNWNSEGEPTYSPVTSHLSIYSESNQVYKGRLGVEPISTDQGIIQLELSKLEKVVNTSADKESSQSIASGTNEFIEGEWRFDIPVKKHPAIVHEFQVETEIDGNPVIFEKLTIAPTITVLSYRYRNENPDRKMEYLTVASIESKEKHAYGQLGLAGYGGGGGSSNGWNLEETTFESLYGEKPTDIRVHIGSASFSVNEQAQFPIDTSKAFPQTFEYLGNEISIEKIEIGKQTKVVMTEELPSERAYEMLNYRFHDKDGRGSSNARVDGYYIDKEDNKYKASENFYRFHDLKNPIFFSTEHHVELSREDNKENFVPAWIEIEGYSETSFYDEIIEISLD